MTLHEAIDALRPFTHKVPIHALKFIREHWEEAEPILLASIENRLADPTDEEHDALFLYAIHLCAEKRSADAFPYFLRIVRLPNLPLDHLLGDILTETFHHMLARTCHGRTDDIKALVEDQATDQFARSTALQSLLVYAAEGGSLELSDVAAYCVELLSHKLECRDAYVWHTAVDLVCELQPPGALPLIEDAYKYGLASADVATPEEMIDRYQNGKPATAADIMAEYSFGSTESAMSFFVYRWGREDTRRVTDKDLLDVLKKRPRERPVIQEPPISRNAPCPCGSGKKYKKCCMPPVATDPFVLSVLGVPVRGEHARANDWMQAGYLHQEEYKSWSAFKCWKACWEELLRILPQELKNPDDAETSGAFAGCKRLEEWLCDFETLLVENAANNVGSAMFAVTFLAEVPARFPDLAGDIVLAMQADRAKCLALLGQREEAVSLLEEMIRARPDFSKPYFILSDMYSFESLKFNMRLDVPKAIRYLRMAQEQAKECLVEERLESELEELIWWEDAIRDWPNREIPAKK